MKHSLPFFFLFFAFGSLGFAKDFHYVDGQCIDQQGVVGLNQISQEQLQETLDGECGDFTDGINIHFTTSLDEERKINLKGAVINNLSLNFIVVSADFSGTQVNDFKMGYHTVKGVADQFTRFSYTDRLSGERGTLDLGVGPFCLSDSSGCRE